VVLDVLFLLGFNIKRTNYFMEKQSLYWVDALRTFATIAVIFLHASGYLLD
jgi:hypothetical protein